MRWLLLGGLILAGCAGSDRPRTALVPAGEPVNCISTLQLRSWRPVDSRTVDFEMTGRQTFRNSLPFACTDLAFGTTIRHSGRVGQLCRGDRIEALGPGLRGPGCQLGDFTPMKRMPVEPAAG